MGSLKDGKHRRNIIEADPDPGWEDGCHARCVGLMAKADELSADDIVDRSEYAYIQTWTDEEIKNCLAERDCDCSKESIERVADMMYRMEDDQILEDALENADIPQKKSLETSSLPGFLHV